MLKVDAPDPVTDAYERLILRSLDYANRVMNNEAIVVSEKKTAIAVAVIGTLGPNPVGLDDIAEAQATAISGAIAAATRQAQAHTGRSMPPGKG